MNNLSRYNKFFYALLAAVIAGVGSLIIALNTDNNITVQEWLMALTVF